jgi:hypothetical protein
MICEECEDGLQHAKCPTCRGELPDKRSRNRFAEDVVTVSPTRCKHCSEEMTWGKWRSSHSVCSKHEERQVLVQYGNRIEHFEGLSGAEVRSRVEYIDGDARAGEIWIFLDGRLQSKTFAEGHQNYGMLCLFQNGKQTSSAQNGETKHVENDRHKRSTFAPDHPRAGEICHFENDRHVQTTFASDHTRFGEVHHLRCGQPSRRTHEKGHSLMGVVHEFEDSEVKDIKIVRITYETGHSQAGAIRRMCAGRFVNKTFEDSHPRAGEINTAVGDGSRLTTFTESHERAGEIYLYKRGVRLNLTYAENHPRAGETQTFQAGRDTLRTFASDHIQAGEIIHLRSNRIVRKTFHESHARAGEMFDYEDMTIRCTYSAGHLRAGEVHRFGQSGADSISFEEKHARFGEVLQFQSGVLLRRTFPIRELSPGNRSSKPCFLTYRYDAGNLTSISKRTPCCETGCLYERDSNCSRCSRCFERQVHGWPETFLRVIHLNGSEFVRITSSCGKDVAQTYKRPIRCCAYLPYVA